MRWFRANRRSCGWLALFALALQIGLSFGHVHAQDFGRQAAGSIVATQPAVSRQVDTVPAPTPADHEPHGPADDSCAICAVMALAGALLVPEPPALALAGLPLVTRAPDRTAALVSGDHPLHARARSPPG